MSTPIRGRLILSERGTVVLEIDVDGDVERTEITAEGIKFESATKAYTVGPRGIVYTRGGPDTT